MILCDIGNSNVDFYHDGKIWSQSLREFKEYSSKDKIYYINVNENLNDILKKKKNFINIEKYFDLDTIYQGMGIDRIASCYTIKDGIVVDAGSAITVDVMSNEIHLGGYILPGLNAYESCYAKISKKLEKRLNPNVATDALPQCTEDAISYAVMKPILMLLQETCKDKRIFFTGGDGKFFSKFFKNAIYDKSLIFRGMLKVIEKSKIEGGINKC